MPPNEPGDDVSMDNSLTLARHFARLVWLLINDSTAKSQQKVALRAVVTVSKEASVRLGNKEGRLAVNGLVMPQALTGVQELAGRLAAHTVQEIEIEQGASAAELLALARLLALESASNSDVADFTQKLSVLAEKTVHVRLLESPVSPQALPTETMPMAAAVATGSQRVRFLFGQLSTVSDPPMASTFLEEIAFAAEQSTREGRAADAADIFSAIIEREAVLTDDDLRRTYVVTMRRLTKPTLLRPIADLIANDDARAVQAERILQRCGQDGVDAAMDGYASAHPSLIRRRYHAVLLRLGATRESLVQMLQDPRWHVVRLAADFLGEMGSLEAERPLADMLRHQDERVRRAVTRALGRIESNFTIDAIGRSLSDPAPAVRLEAVAALAARRSGRAGAVLAKAIDDEAELEVQYALLAALGRVASPDAVQKLTKAAVAASGFFKTKKNVGLRVAAVQALGEARTPGALTALQGLANDKERAVREAIARVLSGAQQTSAA